MRQPVPYERALIVDDEPSILRFTEIALTKKGYLVTATPSAEEALEILRRQRFQLLIVDIIMPGMSGLELLGEALAMNPDMTTAVITGYPSLEYTIQSLKLGADGFIVKPFTTEEMLAELEEARKRSYIRRERTRLTALVPLVETPPCPMGETDLRTMLTAMAETLMKEPGKGKASLIIFDEENNKVLWKLSAKGEDSAREHPPG